MTTLSYMGETWKIPDSPAPVWVKFGDPPIDKPIPIDEFYLDYPQRVMLSSPYSMIKWDEPTDWEPPAELDFTDDTYMDEVHKPELLLSLANDFLEGVEFDTLVGTGLSGTIAVTDLARRLGKNYLVVRKPNDGTHSHLPVEGKLGKRWLFVDDLVSTGSTFARVWDVLHKLCREREFETEFAGTFLYNARYYHPPKNYHHCWLKKRSETYDGKSLYHKDGACW